MADNSMDAFIEASVRLIGEATQYAAGDAYDASVEANIRRCQIVVQILTTTLSQAARPKPGSPAQ